MILDDLGLMPALRAYTKEFTAHTSIPVQIESFATISQLSELKKIVLFRVAQEALTNVGRHSKATWAKVILSKKKNTVQMEICDNGKHFDTQGEMYKNRKKRLGILGMEERVRIIQGQFDIVSLPGKGTVVLVRIDFNDLKNKKHNNDKN